MFCNMASEDVNMTNVSDISEQMDTVTLDDMNNDEAVGNILIAANIDDCVFDEEVCKEQFESMFRSFENSAIVQYLRSFRRARIQYQSSFAASKARVQLHEAFIFGKRLKLYFAKPIGVRCQQHAGPHLEPPNPDKPFLISPPASPPVGWKQVFEERPIINYDLMAAVANLAPGESHELHPPSPCHPAIIVHICEDPEGFADRPKILQTRRPNMT